ncbi:MAG: anhydro-N-acetylmuramic acid kinase [Gallionella sp.]
MQRTPELLIGLMSGTSLDGVDAVLVDFSDGGFKQLSQAFIPFSDDLKITLVTLNASSDDELHKAQLASNQLAQLYASAVTALLSKSNVSNNDVIAIGCHGQTIRHQPEHGYTLQIGNASLLAELTDISVVNDFRSRDIAAGGQGAPLVPAFHDKIFRHPHIHRVIVNIGGISNLTNLPPDHPTSGFDCGPGNILMDAWCRQHQNTAFDDNGAWAASGNILPDLLTQLLSDPFFSAPPPKSSGRDFFNLEWLLNQLTGEEKAEDVQATLLELSCQVIAQSVQQYCAGQQHDNVAKEIYLCGGGAHNGALLARLSTLLSGCHIQTTDVLGANGDFLEALAFAWLAQQTLLGKPANLPSATGAKHPCILGAVHHA